MPVPHCPGRGGEAACGTVWATGAKPCWVGNTTVLTPVEHFWAVHVLVLLHPPSAVPYSTVSGPKAAGLTMHCPELRANEQM